MNILRDIFCAPAAPKLSSADIRNANFQQLLDMTMSMSANLIEHEDLKDEVLDRLKILLKNKSNSPSNIAKIVNQMFSAAIKSCQHRKDLHIIEWLQICISSPLQMAFSEEVRPTNTQPPPSKASNKKGAKAKTQSNTSASLSLSEDTYYRRGNSDSDADYIPDNEGDHKKALIKERPKRTAHKPKVRKASKSSLDAVVPKVKPTRKKRSDINDQLVPEMGKIKAIQVGAGPKDVARYFTSIVNHGNVLSHGYFSKAYFFPSEHSFNAFISTINSAKQSIDICIFSLTDDDIADVLIAAKKRKVNIRIITDNQQSSLKEADAKRLQSDHGIPYKTENSSGYMHNKFAVVDHSTLINGSFNWSKGARFKNRENIVITNIPQCIKEFEGQYEALWKSL
ncbi:hypothetical protein BDF14DRAFT_1870329 [Spinellus fusiger]|nr:hypothetical protein BDF14DRAFT_1870329 [Spinellus fusiger]